MKLTTKSPTVLTLVTVHLCVISLAARAQVEKVDVSSTTGDRLSEVLNKLRQGDRNAVPVVASFDSKAFEPLKQELARPTDEYSQYLALRALLRLPDKRVIPLLVSGQFASRSTSGEFDTLLVHYLWDTIGEPFTEFDYLSSRAVMDWYKKHQSLLVWDEEELHFQRRSGGDGE